MPKQKSDAQFATKTARLRRAIGVHRLMAAHHNDIIRLHLQNIKALQGMAKNGYETARRFQRRLTISASRHTKLESGHRKLENDILKELEHQKNLQNQVHRTPHAKHIKRKRKALGDDPSMQQGNVLGKPSQIYYTRLGMDAYREIQRDFGNDPEFSQNIDALNEKKLGRLAMKKLRNHPLYPRMQYYLDMAQKSEQSMDKPIRVGTMTDGAPSGLYYNEMQYGYPRSGI
jgi:hypothetical protein